jgi:hypothetical protein
VHWRGDHEPAKEHSTRSDIRVTSRDQPLRAGQSDDCGNDRIAGIAGTLISSREYGADMQQQVLKRPQWLRDEQK